MFSYSEDYVEYSHIWKCRDLLKSGACPSLMMGFFCAAQRARPKDDRAVPHVSRNELQWSQILCAVFFDSGDICLLRNNLVYNLDTNVVGIPGEAWWVWKKYMFSPSPTLSENMSAVASLSEILRYHLYQWLVDGCWAGLVQVHCTGLRRRWALWL